MTRRGVPFRARTAGSWRGAAALSVLAPLVRDAAALSEHTPLVLDAAARSELARLVRDAADLLEHAPLYHIILYVILYTETFCSYMCLLES